jgi:hypothetical protein
MDKAFKHKIDRFVHLLPNEESTHMSLYALQTIYPVVP